MDAASLGHYSPGDRTDGSDNNVPLLQRIAKPARIRSKSDRLGVLARHVEDAGETGDVLERLLDSSLGRTCP